MEVTTFLILYAISVPVFFLIDMLWLGVIASTFYRNRIGHMMEIKWPAAVAFYLMYLVGLTYFAIYPGMEEGWNTALFLGGLFGFFTYATYDLTNFSTLKGWPGQIVVVDILWGTVLGAAVSVGTVLLFNLFI